MFEPTKIYDGIHSILRNILPGIIILFPILLFFNKADYSQYSYFLLIFTYLIISAISHVSVDIIGYRFLKNNQKVFKEDTLDIVCPKIMAIQLLYPSYFVYRKTIIKIVRKKLNKPDLTFEKYREIQDNPLYQKIFGDHQYIHRFNSFMICFDISTYGMYWMLIGIALIIMLNSCLYTFPFFNNFHQLIKDNMYPLITVVFVQFIILFCLRLFLTTSLLTVP